MIKNQIIEVIGLYKEKDYNNHNYKKVNNINTRNDNNINYCINDNIDKDNEIKEKGESSSSCIEPIYKRSEYFINSNKKEQNNFDLRGYFINNNKNQW